MACSAAAQHRFHTDSVDPFVSQPLLEECFDTFWAEIDFLRELSGGPKSQRISCGNDTPIGNRVDHDEDDDGKETYHFHHEKVDIPKVSQ